MSAKRSAETKEVAVAMPTAVNYARFFPLRKTLSSDLI